MVTIEESKLCRCSVPFSSICTIACSFEGWFHTISQFFLLSSFLGQQPGYQKISNETKTVQFFKESVHLEIFYFFFPQENILAFFSLLLTFSNATHEAAHSVLCEILGYMGC